jgi:hypothetical protein
MAHGRTAAMEDTASQHRLIRTAITVPAFAALVAASYAVHVCIAAGAFLYRSLVRTHPLVLQRRALGPRS